MPATNFASPRGLAGRRVGPQALEHAARPARALPHEEAEPGGHRREAEGGGLVLHDPAREHQGPRQHDVLADRVGPSAHGAQVICPVGGERPLRDERRVVRGLHALDAVDAQPVVPALHPGEEVGRRVPGHERSRAGGHVLALGTAGDPRDQARHRIRVQERVRVDGHDQRGGHVRECGVQRGVLAGDALEQPPVVEAQPLRRLRRELGRPVGRVVVGQHDLERAGIGEAGDPLERRNDCRLLVPRRDDQRDRGPLPRRPGTRRRTERRRAIARGQQRERQEADQHARDVGEHQRDHPRHDRPDRLLEVRRAMPARRRRRRPHTRR